MNDRLYRSRSDRMLAGVAGGLAEHFDLDPSIVRVGWAILTILSGGIFLLIYIVMAIVVPEEPAGVGGSSWSSAGTSGGSGWGSGWTSDWPSAAGPASNVAPPGGPSSAGEAPADGQPAPAAPAAPALDVTPGAGGGDAPAAMPLDSAAATAPADASAAGFGAPIVGGWTPPAAPGTPSPGGSWSGAGLSRHEAREARRAARRAARGYGSDRPGSGGLIGGLVLVLLGIYFLVQTFAPQVGIDRFWPAGLVLIGVILVGLSIRRTPGSPTP